MALVFNEPREGPATHALVIGYESPGSGAAAPYSAAVTAHRIADLLLGLDLVDAPLASIDLLASYSGTMRANYLSPRDNINYSPEPPIFNSVGTATSAWFERLQTDTRNIAFFYFAGPLVALPDGTVLGIPGNRPDPRGGVVFDNIWSAMAAHGAPLRQLYFLDGCPAVSAFGEGPPGDLIVRGPEGSVAPERALYLASFDNPDKKQAPGDEPSIMSRALGDVLSTGDAIGAVALGALLREACANHIRGAAWEGHKITTRCDRDFVLRYRAATGFPSADSAGEPAGPEADATAPEGVTAPADQDRNPDPVAETDAGRVAKLTQGQRDVLRLVYEHLETKEIARQLGISPDGVSQRLRSAMRILGVNRRRDAAMMLSRAEGNAADPQRVYPPQDVGSDPPRVYPPQDISVDAPPPGSSPDGGADSQPPASQSGKVGRGRQGAEPNTHFVDDDPEVERDELGRGPLAIALGRRLHRIWCRSNGITVPGSDDVAADHEERAAFVLHLDAPWGGGKTSFANFLARVLNPFPGNSAGPANFLIERSGGSRCVGTIFIDDPPPEGQAGGAAASWPEAARRPWIVVPFNAWQAEHCAPPWWVFYQAIRKGCFRAVRTEGTEPAKPAGANPPARRWLRGRGLLWAGLWRRELWWRLRNPKIVALLSTFVLTALVTGILWNMDLIFNGERGPAFATGNALGFILAAITGVSGLWGLGALLRDSVVPGSDDAAERRTLGGGDPLERFRCHFRRTMAAVRRPVMVVVDDLDRCRPDFVVDLVRGIQTLLKSPRVVFVILGDRDWIERAFEAHHDAMKTVNVGAEQSFGARFVEKAIQMSFILPEMPEGRRDSYVRGVLLGPGAGKAAPGAAPPPPEALSQQLRADYRQQVASAETVEDRKRVEEQLREKYQPAFQAAAQAGTGQATATKGEAVAIAGEQAGKVLGEERALRAAVDERMGKALLHRLEPLAQFFPPNPRQIKRIVNAITMYTCVAYLQMDMDESDPRGVELAIWVIIMTEWPDTWRVLASCPKLVDVLAEEDPAKALAALDDGQLPGSRASTLKELDRIRADRNLHALIAFETRDRPRLRSESVALFTELTPLYSRKRRLADDPAPPAPRGEAAKKRTGRK